jgi:3-methyladenine DNA glycosylase AlkD
MDYDTILTELQSLTNPANVAGMARFGIRPTSKVYGISMTTLRQMKKRVGKNHALAAQLWNSRIHEARLLATLVDDPKQVTEAQMDEWVNSFDTWDICDQCCINLFRSTPYAYQKALEWSEREEEFVKRAGFVLMATLAVHDKKAADEIFAAFLPIIQREAGDSRNFVKKAVNWALRQIGKRNLHLNTLAIQTAQDIQQLDSKSARWIAADALKELTSPGLQDRLQPKIG